MTPFGNTFDTLEMRGDHLLETLEHGVTKSYEEDRFVGPHMLQFTGKIHVYPFNDNLMLY